MEISKDYLGRENKEEEKNEKLTNSLKLTSTCF
jgi:hypothetical protein